jgi:CBS domain-containing protein
VLVKDIMSKEVFSVPVGLLVSDLIDIMIEKDISCAPVIDRAGYLVGIVSREDIIHSQLYSERRELSHTDIMEIFKPPYAGKFQLGHMNERPGMVSEIMTRKVVAADHDTSVADLSLIMAKEKTDTILITVEGRLVGMVTAFDILKHYSKEGDL